MVCVCVGTRTITAHSRWGFNRELKPDREKLRRRQLAVSPLSCAEKRAGKRVGEGKKKKEKAVLIFWSLHFPSGLVSNKLPRTHPCTHQSHYASPPSLRHWVNSTVCRETKNQQHNETADDELDVCVCVCMCMCVCARVCFKCFAWNLLRSGFELAATHEG